MAVCLGVQGLYHAVSADSLPTSKSTAKGYISYSVQRASTDAYFYADVTLHDAIVGSRYWLVDNADYSTVLSTGLITDDPQVLSSIPSYGSPMLIMLRIRSASGGVKYKEYSAIVPHATTGTSFYCAQEVDE